MEGRGEKKMSYAFFVSAPGREPENLKEKEDEVRQSLFAKLGRQFIEKGLGGTNIDEESDRIPQ
ncbi:MAG: hypothetical protein K2P76_05665 [Lachnospiraceae bacterium]|nr:hypothetical protein [Lachnospiraceae bacterium]